MAMIEPPRDSAFLPEVWGLYILGTVVFAIRFLLRIRSDGITGMRGDDYMAFSAWVFYTIDAVTVDRSYYYGTNVDFTDAQFAEMSSAQLHDVQLGSKYEFIAWFSYPALIWSMKGTMLFFYRRLTLGLWQQHLVKWLAAICFLSYVAVLLTVFFGCRPIQNNWQVWPSPGLQCTFRLQNIATVCSFNIATDVALLSVPLPLLWKLQIPKKQKLVIAIFLLTGVMVIAAATIRMVVTLGSNPSTITINKWGVRETIVAMICINMPILRPLFSKDFWKMKSLRSSQRTTNNGQSVSRGPFSRVNGSVPGTVSQAKRSAHSVMDDNGSEEYIMDKLGNQHTYGERETNVQGDIHIETNVHVQTISRTESQLEMGNTFVIGNRH